MATSTTTLHGLSIDCSIQCPVDVAETTIFARATALGISNSSVVPSSSASICAIRGATANQDQMPAMRCEQFRAGGGNAAGHADDGHGLMLQIDLEFGRDMMDVLDRGEDRQAVARGDRHRAVFGQVFALSTDDAGHRAEADHLAPIRAAISTACSMNSIARAGSSRMLMASSGISYRRPSA